MADIASHPAGGRAELRAERHSGDRRDRRARAAAARDARAGEMPPASVTVIEEQVLRGPSRYSRQPMIRLLVDLGPLEAYPSNAIPGFVDALLDALPALVEHTCSYGRPGGFVRRLQEGTWLGHVVEHVALQLQGVVGQRVTRGKTRSAGPVGRYNVLYTYRTEQVGLEAGRIAVSLVNRLIARPDEVQGVQLAADVERLRGLAERYGLGPSTQAIVDEAATRHIPVLPLG